MPENVEYALRQLLLSCDGLTVTLDGIVEIRALEAGERYAVFNGKKEHLYNNVNEAIVQWVILCHRHDPVFSTRVK